MNFWKKVIVSKHWLDQTVVALILLAMFPIAIVIYIFRKLKKLI